MIGAVLCEPILRRNGKEGLLQLISEGEDPWPALARCGITPETLTGELAPLRVN